MPRNVGSSTNQYSRPSCSWPRAERVVCDTDTTRCESSSSSDLTRLDLPAPLGAATTKRLPGYSMQGLFEVLHLFAQLLDRHFHLDRDVGELEGRGLRAERVCFTQ